MAIKRAITSILLISMIIGVIFVDWLCGLVVTLFIIGGLYEFFCMLDKKGISAYKKEAATPMEEESNGAGMFDKGQLI